MAQLIEKARLGRLNALDSIRRSRTSIDPTIPWIKGSTNVAYFSSRRD